MRNSLIITARILPDGSTFTVKGRDAWALDELLKTGQKGCTPINNPAPRWSAYVFNLKHNQGLNIETRHEPHYGPFAGTHGRYVLLSKVEIISQSDALPSITA